MKLKLDEPMKTFQGEPMTFADTSKPVTTREALCLILGRCKEDPVATWTLGVDISKSNGEIELSGPPLELLRRAVRDDPAFSVVVKGQVLKALEG